MSTEPQDWPEDTDETREYKNSLDDMERESGEYCCKGQCCGPGSWCCKRAGHHDECG